MINSTRRFILSLTVRFILVFFSSISIAITSLGKERAGLCAFRAFVYFARVDLCLFPLPLGVRNRLQLVIVTLPGLFLLLVHRLYGYVKYIDLGFRCFFFFIII